MLTYKLAAIGKHDNVGADNTALDKIMSDILCYNQYDCIV